MSEGIEPTLLAISVGNTRTAVGRFVFGKLEEAARFANTDRSAIEDIVLAWWQLIVNRAGASVVMASVNHPVADDMASDLASALEAPVLRIGRDLEIPIGLCVNPDAFVGQDRLLNAAAVFDRFKQACVVIDAGTAITVDFVDGVGTFHGGAIGPGARMQLSAMHKGTAQLPEIKWEAPTEGEFFGANTKQAMLQGVFYGIRGMVRHLAERYAESYMAYPNIIATGGDAHLLFDGDDLIEHIVDDLTLHGIAVACKAAIAGEAAEAEGEAEDDER